jgi:hypothetical protein
MPRPMPWLAPVNDRDLALQLFIHHPSTINASSAVAQTDIYRRVAGYLDFRVSRTDYPMDAPM